MDLRRYWVQAELRCQMCARSIGRLLGAAPPGVVNGGIPSVPPGAFSIFHPADAGEPVVRLCREMRFRCRTCGGNALLEDVEVFSTWDDGDELEEPRKRRRGRPPKPWRSQEDSRLVAFKMAG